MFEGFCIDSIQIQQNMKVVSSSSISHPLKLQISRQPGARILLRLRKLNGGVGTPRSISSASSSSPLQRGRRSVPEVIPSRLKPTRLTAQLVAMRTVARWAAECSDGQQLSTAEFSREVVDTITNFMRYYGGGGGRWVYPWLYYCGIYIKECPLAQTNGRELFRILRVSALLTAKFWNDFEIGNKDASKILNLPMKTLTASEKNFLNTLDYNLYIPAASLNSFKKDTRKNAQQAPVS